MTTVYVSFGLWFVGGCLLTYVICRKISKSKVMQRNCDCAQGRFPCNCEDDHE